MNNIKEALSLLLKISDLTGDVVSALESVGITSDTFDNIYGLALDAIYALIGEHTETIEESVTYMMTAGHAFTDEQRVDALLKEYKTNILQRPEQPHPITTEQEKMLPEYNEVVGYKEPDSESKPSFATLDKDGLRYFLDVGNENGRLRELLRDCLNEHCIECGKCTQEHLGACDSCKWHSVKYGEILK